MVSKKMAIVASIATTILLLSILIPSLLYATNNDSPSVTRLYADSLEGPWSNTSNENTRWVQKITVVDGQMTIHIQEVSFIWEAPEDTLLFYAHRKGETGPEGLKGPPGGLVIPDVL
jgi:hypothetical protein